MDNQKQSLINNLRDQGFNLPFSKDLSPYNTSLVLRGKTIDNRIGILPLEGFDSNLDGSPSEMVYRRYTRFVRSGAGIIWFEACAVNDGGKSNPNQMSLNSSNLVAFKNLLNKMDEEALALSRKPAFKILQLTHSGRMSKDKSWNPIPLIAHKNLYEETNSINDLNIASDDKIKKIIEEHISVAKLAYEAGFDAVDIKACHGYFLSELLGAYNRPGLYGGSFENRTRALFEIIDGIKSQLGNKIVLTVRLNAFDSVPPPYGYGVICKDKLEADLTETIKICQMLSDYGVEIINISASSPQDSVFGVNPTNNIYKKYVSSTDLLMAVKLIKEQVPDIYFMCTGLSSFGEIGAEIGAGGLKERWFDIAGFGRQALSYPDFAYDILYNGGLKEDYCCIGCNSCFKLMDPGHTMTGCIVNDKEIYLPLYQKHVLKREN